MTGPSSLRRAHRLGGEHDETRGVVLGVLDIGACDFEPVDLGGELRGNHRGGAVAGLAQMARGAGGIRLGDRLQLERADRLAALAERHDMAMHRLELGQLDARQREQLVADPLEMLGDDMQPRMRQQMMNVGDAAGHRVLDRDHGELGGAGLNRGERILEGGTGKSLHARIGILRRQMRIGARLALEGDFVGARCGHQFGEAGFGLAAGLKQETRPLKVGRSIDTERDSVNEADMDAHAGFQRP